MADVIPSPSNPGKQFLSDKASLFTESVIREMTRQAMLHGAVNLAQGFPDFPAPAEIKQAAQQAIAGDVNQYAITWGSKNLRQAIARQMGVWQGISVDPEKEVTVCCGSTEAMISTLLAVSNPGDEVIIFEPFYENYGPDSVLSGARPRFVKLRPPEEAAGEWTLDETELRAAFHRNTKAIIVNTPNNPTGKVFTQEELNLIRDLCVEFDVLAITDEIYEHILYDGKRHISLASLDGMRERTVTINGMSKTYSVTGWRVGWAVAPEKITSAIRKVHDFLTVGAPAPLQEAGAMALSLPAEYYAKLAEGYRGRRDHLVPALERAGFQCFLPRGAYYVMTDIAAFGFPDDLEFTKYLVREVGVAAVPGSSFYQHPRDGARQVRFAFCKKPETLDAAAERLSNLRVRN
jgi:aspartate/methionine/tyrosine aminotransferase